MGNTISTRLSSHLQLLLEGQPRCRRRFVRRCYRGVVSLGPPGRFRNQPRVPRRWTGCGGALRKHTRRPKCDSPSSVFQIRWPREVGCRWSRMYASLICRGCVPNTGRGAAAVLLAGGCIRGQCGRGRIAVRTVGGHFGPRRRFEGKREPFSLGIFLWGMTGYGRHLFGRGWHRVDGL